ncbi:hypothetical protein [Hyalangium versicolor]|uniref:hypothetical protein n=1 Tax=Hyalangium versicolor TaxID=2861190 RepID=UPI001CC9B5FF|nr:hypothetical protein [Hyalangium versicolor]
MRLVSVMGQEIEAPRTHLLHQRFISGNEVRYTPWEDGSWKASGSVLRVLYHELEVTGVGVEEGIDAGRHGYAGEYVYSLDVDDGLDPLRCGQPGDRSEVEGETGLPAEDERGTERHCIQLSQPLVPRDEIQPLRAGFVERQRAKLGCTEPLINGREMGIEGLSED